MSDTNYKKDGTNILVPIKAIIKKYADINGSEYKEDEFNLLRRYFISCLNMGYFSESELETYVDKFTSEIHAIVCCDNGSIPILVIQNNTSMIQWFRGGYTAFEQVLYINSDNRYNAENHSKYEILFFQAVTSVLIKATEDSPALAVGLTQIIADRLYNYDQTERRVAHPKAEEFILGDRTLVLRSGFTNNKLIATLTRQLLIFMDENEYRFLKSLYKNGFYDGFDKIKSDVHCSILIHWLDELEQVIATEIICYVPESEWYYIKKFECDANEYFKNKNSTDYYAFLALVPDIDLLKEFKW